ncbi:MAG: hypothetical protein JSS49_29240 [Planctomycetes bacterium]|nr:hypothetical protein [Planctomycetota bacterium]
MNSCFRSVPLFTVLAFGMLIVACADSQPVSARTEAAGAKRFHDQLNEKLSRMRHQQDTKSSLEANQQLAFFPLSEAVSGCVTSGCAASGCPLSGCAGSACGGSGCVGSGCGGSVCVASGCIGSGCAGSGCAGSACISSGCAGSACVGTGCAGSACTSGCKAADANQSGAAIRIVGLDAVRADSRRYKVRWALEGSAVEYRLFRHDQTTGQPVKMVSAGTVQSQRLLEIDDSSAESGQVYSLEITDPQGRVVRASFTING